MIKGRKGRDLLAAMIQDLGPLIKGCEHFLRAQVTICVKITGQLNINVKGNVFRIRKLDNNK